MYNYLNLLKTTEKLNDEQLHLIIKEEIESNRLNKYVDTIDVSSDNKFHGYYFQKKLSVNPSKILEMSYSCATNEFLLKKIPIHKIYNMYALLVIYHEINHAIQEKESLKLKEDAVHEIIKEGVELGNKDKKDYSLNDRIINTFFYKKMLIERNAEIMAVSKVIKNNESIDFLTEDQLKHLRDYLKYLIKYGYSKGKNPSRTYYQLRGKPHEYYQLKFNKNYDLLESLSFGLPVDYELVQEAINNPKILEIKKTI